MTASVTQRAQSFFRWLANAIVSSLMPLVEKP